MQTFNIDPNSASSLGAGVYMIDDDDPNNTVYRPNNFELNVGNSQSQGVSTPSTSTKNRQPIHQAAGIGNLAMLKLFFETDPSCAGVAGTDGATAVGMAAEQGHLDIVKLLLTYEGVDGNGGPALD